MIPVLKSGEKTNVSNVGPISLVSSLAKIYEKLLYMRLCHFLDKHKIMAKNQFSFSERIGTNLAILNLTDCIYSTLDKTPTIATFLDLTEAFDTVNHNIILEKLQVRGIRRKARDLIKN